MRVLASTSVRALKSQPLAAIQLFGYTKILLTQKGCMELGEEGDYIPVATLSPPE